MKIIGKGNTNIIDMWKKDGPQSYYGIVSNWTPNLFHLHGPNTVNKYFRNPFTYRRYSNANYDVSIGYHIGIRT